MALWILLLTSTSHVLLTINASMNFFLYCIMSTAFREELLAWVYGSQRRGSNHKNLRNGNKKNGGRASNGGSVANSINGINKIGNGEKERMIAATNV